MKQHYIYLTTNLVNGKQYIGQHYGELNDSYFGSGVIILKALKEFGKQNFTKEILEITTEDKIDEVEKYYIDLYNAVEDDNFYNISEGGQNGNGWKYAQKYWKDHPEEAKQVQQNNIKQLQAWWKEHPVELENNNKLLVEEAKKWRLTHPDEVQQHMKKVNQAKEKWQQEHPEEHQKQVDQWRVAGSKANSKKVLCVTTNEEFESASAAGRLYNIPQSNISKCCRGERNSAGKHPETKEKMVWKYI